MIAALASLVLVCSSAASVPQIDGQLVAWHPLAVTFSGPEAAETDNGPNPFLDIRLQVEFVGPLNQRYDVPGFFDGDGKSGPKGNVWRARFSPDAAGPWSYTARFRKGPGVAIQLEPDAGEAFLPEGTTAEDFTGTFEIAPRDADASGFLKWGFLGYAGKHYLRFAEGPYWIRGGTDEPENLLAFAGFDNTPPKHRYAAHEEDWREGDPDWGADANSGGRGRAIIGMVNYLAREHVNSMYFLLMNVGGDGKDVWPWAGKIDGRGSKDNDNLHYDTAKLRQWETVFAHAQRKGVFLHTVFNEAEEANKRELDDGELGPERKLYYREMIARFGHHLALEWNLCEEYNLNFDFGPERLGAFASYVRAVDPYDHPIAVHSAGDPVEELRFMYGDPRYDMTSVQLNQKPIHEVTEAMWRETRKAGRPIPISMDEFTLDRGQRASHIPVDDADGYRREKLWPTYFSGGMIEFILEGLLKTDSFKLPQREKLWRFMWIARHFMEEELPFWEMEPADELMNGGGTIELGVGKGVKVPLGPQVFVKRGEVYAVYLPTATPSGTLDLTGLTGEAELRWFNPRSGEFAGQTRQVQGGGPVELSAAPADTEQDWVVLVKRTQKSAGMPSPTKSSGGLSFPGKHWETRSPVEVGLKEAKLDAFAARLGGDGCVVRDGYLVKTWGDVTRHKDWASAAKPVLSTLLLAAVADGKLASVDALVKDADWPLNEKDAAITYRHLANMVSGYGCAEPPGAAWGYNDFAIQLYAKSLERVLGQPLDAVLRERFAGLQFEDGAFFGSRDGLGVSASVRDFARLGWLWLNAGSWSGQQVLPEKLLQECFRPGVAANLPRTADRREDYLGIGSYGGGTDQTAFGPGVYGFNFWFNTPDANGRRGWPALPADAYQANGMWNRDTLTVIPSLRMVVAVRGAERGKFQPGDEENGFNQTLGLLAEAAGTATSPAQEPPSILGFGSGAHHWRRIRDDSRAIQATENQAAYDPSQVPQIVANILLFQRANGGWPKDYDMLAVLNENQRAAIQATHDRADTSFDNSNGHSQVEYLAKADAISGSPESRAACLRGLDHLLAAELPGGGFPQRYPDGKDYHGHITFNDGVMIGILNVLKDAADGAPHWKWLDEARREKARVAVERGIACILKCQIRVGEQRKGWCQQHDAQTFAPASARTFELASSCPQETAEIMRFLIQLQSPSPEVVVAVKDAATWLQRVKLHDLRCYRVPAPAEEFLRHKANFDSVVVRELDAPPLWARHYEIETDRPIFAGRDGVKRYALADIERERRTGTPWYGAWPKELLATEYPQWLRGLGK